MSMMTLPTDKMMKTRRKRRLLRVVRMWDMVMSECKRLIGWLVAERRKRREEERAQVPRSAREECGVGCAGGY
jgi:hypothetical protein